jgi:hypothetical protein
MIRPHRFTAFLAGDSALRAPPLHPVPDQPITPCGSDRRDHRVRDRALSWA